MNLPRLLSLFLVVQVLSASADDIVGELMFFGGDRLGGLSGVSYQDGRLVLPKGASLAEPTEVRLENVSELRLAGGDALQVRASYVTAVEFTNGDVVRGELKALDDAHVTLGTWDGGTLRIRRAMCRTLRIDRVEPAIYAGPGAPDDWLTVEGEKAWSIQDYQLVSTGPGSIARRIELPARCRLSFKLGWETVPDLQMFLFSKEGGLGANLKRSSYELIVQRRYVYLRKRWNTKTHSRGVTIGNVVSLPEFASGREAHLELFVDRSAGTITLFVDGREEQVWNDAEPEKSDLGNWFVLVANDEPLRISRVRASAWTGELPAADDGEMVVKASEFLRTREGGIEAPAKRSLKVDLSGGEVMEQRLMKGDVRAWWRDGGHVTFQLKALDDSSITGFSQSIGAHTFDLRAFSRVEFNIYNEDRGSGR